ncbi:unnamed protein product [Symbiodinium sp. CCMP2592]|nr:unnamed protein product [Symbiodinium sp. CCMP2592]
MAQALVGFPAMSKGASLMDYVRGPHNPSFSLLVSHSALAWEWLSPLAFLKPQWIGVTLHPDRLEYSKDVSNHSLAVGQKGQYFVCKCGAWTSCSKVQQGQTHCQQCGKKWPAPPAPARQQPTSPQKHPKSPSSSPSPQRDPDRKERREEERRLKRAVTTIWDQIPEEARSRLVQAGWKGPPKQKDAVESQTDPLLSLLVQRQDELPEDLTRASSRLRVLIHKKIKLLESIEEAKESLRLQLQELQETTEKIHEAENAVEKAKLELTKAVGTPAGVQDVPVTPEPMDVDELVTILGLTLSDEQQEKLAEYRAKPQKGRGLPRLGCTRAPLGAKEVVLLRRTVKGVEVVFPLQHPPKSEAKTPLMILFIRPVVAASFANDNLVSESDNGTVAATPREEFPTTGDPGKPDPQIQRVFWATWQPPKGDSPAKAQEQLPAASAQPSPLQPIAERLALACTEAESLEDAEEAIVAFGEAVEMEPEGSLAYRLGWDLLEGLQGSGWLDPLAAAFAHDIAAQGPIHITSANVTTWKKELLTWHPATKGILALQELHLNAEGLNRPSAVSRRQRGQACGGMITEEGCGYVAVALPRLRWTLLVVCVRQAGAPRIPQLDGGWRLERTLLAPEGPTINTGNTLDYALLARHFTSDGGRGTNNPLQHKPLMQQDWSYPWRGHIVLVGNMPPEAVEATTLHLTQQGSTKAPGKAETDAVAEWLVMGTRRGMRPLFRCLSKAETNVARPFAEVAAESRPYERLKYWATLWQARGSPTPYFPELRRQAVEQAKQLPAVTGRQMYRYIRSMPCKAPGLDGWDVPFLKSLSIEEVHTLADLWREVELEGVIPHQANRASLWWDSALPSRSTHDASLRRAFLYEACRVDKVHRCTIFFNLSTFYERVSHEKLCEEAAHWGFPPLLLNLGMQAYRGGRIVTAASPSGLLVQAPWSDYVGCWVDDVSADVVHKTPERAAAGIVTLFRRLNDALEAEGNEVSASKTHFMASSPEAERALRRKLGKGDPPVRQLTTKDLGMETAAGRRRTAFQSAARRLKANRRFAKLQSLRLPALRVRSRLFSMSVMASGSEGVSPKVMKSLRFQAAQVSRTRRVMTGSVEVALELGGPPTKDSRTSIIGQHWAALGKAISRQTGCETLDRGIDLTVPRQLTKGRTSNARLLVVERPFSTRTGQLGTAQVTYPFESLWQVGSACGVLPPGTTVPQAIARVCARTRGLRQQKSLVVNWPWLQGGDRRENASLTWVRKQVNDAADHLCRKAADRATAQAGQWCPDEIDDLVREVTRFLQHRASVLLVSHEQPPWDLTPQRKPKRRRFRAEFGEASLWRKQVNDAADHLCRKAAARATAQAGQWCPDEIDDLVREGIEALIREGTGGHTWEAHPTAIASAACSVCGLYIKQLMPLWRFNRVAAHQCRHRETPAELEVHGPGHSKVTMTLSSQCENFPEDQQKQVPAFQLRDIQSSDEESGDSSADEGPLLGPADEFLFGSLTNIQHVLVRASASKGLSKALIKVATDAGWTLSTFRHAADSPADLEKVIPDIFGSSELSRLQIAQVRAAWAGLSSSASSAPPAVPTSASETSSWVETFAPKITALKLTEYKKAFLAAYTSEILSPCSMPSLRLVSLAAHQESKKDYKWIPWKHRMSEEKAAELQLSRPAKQPRLEALGISSLLLDEPPTLEVGDNFMGVSAVQRILAIHDVALAMGIYALVLEKDWNLNDAIFEYTEIRGIKGKGLGRFMSEHWKGYSFEGKGKSPGKEKGQWRDQTIVHAVAIREMQQGPAGFLGPVRTRYVFMRHLRVLDLLLLPRAGNSFHQPFWQHNTQLRFHHHASPLLLRSSEVLLAGNLFLAWCPGGPPFPLRTPEYLDGVDTVMLNNLQEQCPGKKVAYSPGFMNAQPLWSGWLRAAMALTLVPRKPMDQLPYAVHDGATASMNGPSRLLQRRYEPSKEPLFSASEGALSIDIKSAHKRCVVKDAEQGLLGFTCEEPDGSNALYFYRTCPFGATFAQHWWGRLGSCILRILHILIYIAHTGHLFVDDYLFSQAMSILPATSAMICMFMQIIGVPLSWHKLQISVRVTWIGWDFQYSAGIVLLKESKRLKLLGMVQDLRKNPRLTKKDLERFIGLALWATSLFPVMKSMLHTFYHDLYSPAATNYSIPPERWHEIARYLSPDLLFTVTPPGWGLPLKAARATEGSKEESEEKAKEELALVSPGHLRPLSPKEEMEAGELEEEQADETMGMPDGEPTSPADEAEEEAEDGRPPLGEGGSEPLTSDPAAMTAEAESPAEVNPPPNPLPPPEWLYRLDVECYQAAGTGTLNLQGTPGKVAHAHGPQLGGPATPSRGDDGTVSVGDALCMRVPTATAKLYATTVEGFELHQDSTPPVVSVGMLWCIACRVRAPSPEHMQAHLMTVSHVLAVAEYLASFREPASG